MTGALLPRLSERLRLLVDMPLLFFLSEDETACRIGLPRGIKPYVHVVLRIEKGYQAAAGKGAGGRLL